MLSFSVRVYGDLHQQLHDQLAVEHGIDRNRLLRAIAVTGSTLASILSKINPADPVLGGMSSHWRNIQSRTSEKFLDLRFKWQIYEAAHRHLYELLLQHEPNVRSRIVLSFAHMAPSLQEAVHAYVLRRPSTNEPDLSPIHVTAAPGEDGIEHSGQPPEISFDTNAFKNFGI